VFAGEQRSNKADRLADGTISPHPVKKQGDAMSSAASAPLPGQSPLSEVERVVDTFVAPRKTFTDIRRSASWWLPFVLMAVSSFALVYVVDQKFGMEKVVENQMALSPKQAAKLDQLPPEQRAAQMEGIVKLNRTISYAYPVLALIFAVIVAAVLLATFSAHRDSGGKHRRSGRLYLPEPGRQQPGRVGGPEFALPLRDCDLARPVHNLDAGAGGNRLFVPDEGQTRHLHGGRLWLVAGGGFRRSGN
jgi:hypothetical protein